MSDRSIGPPTLAHESYAAFEAGVNATLDYVGAEIAWLESRERETPVGWADATCEHEAKMVRIGARALSAWQRHGCLPAGLAPWLPNRLQAAIRRVERALRERLALWGWDQATIESGRATVALVGCRKAALHSLIDAAASWVPADEHPDDFAAGLADMALMLGVEPTMTPEAAKAAFDDLRHEWFDRPLLIDATPEISADELGRLFSDAEALRVFLQSVIPPSDMLAHAQALEADASPAPNSVRSSPLNYAPAKAAPVETRHKGGRPRLSKADEKLAKRIFDAVQSGKTRLKDAPKVFGIDRKIAMRLYGDLKQRANRAKRKARQAADEISVKGE